MKPLYLLTATSALALAIVTFHPAYAEDTKDFVVNASSSNMFEVESSRLALQRSKNAEVKKFAQQMVDDHTKAGEDMKAALGKSKVSAQVPANKLTDKHQKMLDDLKKADAADFDEDYIDAQVKAHKEAVSLFEDYSDDGDDAALKEFAGKTLPTLKKHEDHVEAIDSKM